MLGYFIISRPWEKHWCLRIFASLSFPFPHFNLNTLKVSDHLQVTWLTFQQWMCHIFSQGHRAKTVCQVSWQLIKTIRFISNATLPNYANYNVNHALTCHLISYEYLHDATSNLNVCLSIGKAWKFINVLAMTFTLKRIITSLKTKKQIIKLIVHPLFVHSCVRWTVILQIFILS